MSDTQKTILIADDDRSIVDTIALVLEASDYEVIQVNDGTSVMQSIKANPDLVLLDIMMSGHDGRTVCKQIKRQASTKQIPVLMISGSPDIEGAAAECGADDYLAKPFGMEELLQKINALLVNA